MNKQQSNHEMAPSSVPAKSDITTWQTLTVGNFGSVEEIEATLRKLPCGRSWDKDFPFLIQPRTLLELCVQSGSMLGQVANLSRAEICRLGVDRGLMECPQEVGPQLIIQGKLPKGSLEMKIASVEPLGGKCDILMSVNSRLGMPWVHVEFDPATGFDPDTLWIFVKSKITTP